MGGGHDRRPLPGNGRVDASSLPALAVGLDQPRVAWQEAEAARWGPRLGLRPRRRRLGRGGTARAGVIPHPSPKEYREAVSAPGRPCGRLRPPPGRRARWQRLWLAVAFAVALVMVLPGVYAKPQAYFCVDEGRETVGNLWDSDEFVYNRLVAGGWEITLVNDLNCDLTEAEAHGATFISGIFFFFFFFFFFFLLLHANKSKLITPFTETPRGRPDSVLSTTVDFSIKDVTTPLVVWEWRLYDDLKWCPEGTASARWCVVGALAAWVR